MYAEKLDQIKCDIKSCERTAIRVIKGSESRATFLCDKHWKQLDKSDIKVIEKFSGELALPLKNKTIPSNSEGDAIQVAKVMEESLARQKEKSKLAKEAKREEERLAKISASARAAALDFILQIDSPVDPKLVKVATQNAMTEQQKEQHVLDVLSSLADKQTICEEKAKTYAKPETKLYKFYPTINKGKKISEDLFVVADNEDKARIDLVILLSATPVTRKYWDKYKNVLITEEYNDK